MFRQDGEALVCTLNGEALRLDALGTNGIRVRGTMNPAVSEGPVPTFVVPPGPAEIEIGNSVATIRNGDLVAEVLVTYPHGEPKQELALRFHRTDGTTLLQEIREHFAWPPTRHYKAVAGETWRVEATFAALNGERFYGLGQRQHARMDQKGCVLSLLQRNAEINIPFAISNRGYGFLWNNPAAGRVELGQTLTRWVAEQSRQLDYWVTTGAGPADILANYVAASGPAPEFPEWASGFWQCKLRYQSQAELLEVAREYKRRELPLACIVIDFFHWPRMGDWRFDEKAWPDPAAMMRELKDLGVEVMVSIWPTVNPNSENWLEMQQRGYLVSGERGLPVFLPFVDADTGPDRRIHMAYYDPTHPGARAFVAGKARANYLPYGIHGYWLDACEPEIRPYQPEHARYHLGNGLEVTNAYPWFNQLAFDEGVRKPGGERVLFLSRSAWAGSQRFGTAVWSGDITSTFAAFRAQIPAGLNAGMSGLAWWTADIGGFYEGNGRDPEFRELLVRWFQWGVFCPIFRLHGFRVPDEVAGWNEKPVKPYGSDAVQVFVASGGSNEVWSWGEEIYQILVRYMAIRERLRPYMMEQTRLHSRTGMPLMRALVLDFPNDPEVADIGDTYLFGPDLLVAPVTEYRARSREVYLPRGSTWTDAWTGVAHAGGEWVAAEAPLDRIPLYLRDGARLPLLEAK